MSPADKLRKVADFVEGLDPQLFDMGFWVRRLTRDKVLDLSSLEVLNKALQEPSCGTAACFMGWATAVFPDQVSIDKVGYSYVPVNIVTGEEGSLAIESLFGLSRREATALCDSGHYYGRDLVPIQEQVVARAREYADMVEERSHVTSR